MLRPFLSWSPARPHPLQARSTEAFAKAKCWDVTKQHECVWHDEKREHNEEEEIDAAPILKLVSCQTPPLASKESKQVKDQDCRPSMITPKSYVREVLRTNTAGHVAPT